MDAQPDNDKEPDNDVEIEPAVDLDNPPPKNKCYDRRDFVARKHGKEREPWVQKPIVAGNHGHLWDQESLAGSARG